MSFLIKSAEIEKRYLKACLYGESNGGKTLTSLLLMRELVGEEGQIAVIDTEYGRSALYKNVVRFDMLDLSLDENGDKVEKPYTQARYLGALQTLLHAGYEGIIIDSLTHVWKRPGGILDQHQQIVKSDKWKNNSFGAWQDTDVIYYGLLDAISSARAHLICTLRANEDWQEAFNEHKKKNEWVKQGTKPEFRSGISFEFDFFAKMSQRGLMTIETWRTLDPYEAEVAHPGRELAEQLLAWLDGTTPPPPTIEQSLASFQKAFPAYCLKKANWREVLLCNALNLMDGNLPLSYSEEERASVKAYVEEKKAEARERALLRQQQESQTGELSV